MPHTFNVSLFEAGIFTLNTPASFEAAALQIFRQQAQKCAPYQAFLHYLKTDISQISRIEQIPFLPVEVFKTHKVVTQFYPDAPAADNSPIVFTSSGTTGQAVSKHYVQNVLLYEHSFMRGFEHFYGPVNQYCVLALLPAYLERQGSSLVYMAQHLIEKSGHKQSGFYLYNTKQLAQTLSQLTTQKQPILLLGVSFALLDFAQQYPQPLPFTIIMETGGMKGRHREITRPELHKILQTAFNRPNIHAEYGMTELLSQAYSLGNGLFTCPPWMRVLPRNVNDPLDNNAYHQTSGLNIIDLANIHACSFIATQDLGKVYANNQFEVLGRFDYSDVRGCNLMLS
ncbi:MAG: acyl transferase [Sphingobacteriales bacterium]|jgi:phenylacetate-coenzyme A ligase PaaK-like adenylate-forming protein|nr:acyl transferase [Sphingobacteriales bacterium]MBP9141654.1 acyl transferase [Chitinophagales bacterium]MDA0198841.1 acyl transferase [Bacteroidota bacterium]MBK6891117.1 acyl transferase [Sphingobacteriales bacterium]MBK7527057.1 acyl transferase [Sphingobacteriales bacterium]